MNIIITLAGHSRRFAAAGYEKPKFLIYVGNQPMIKHVLGMFSDADNYFLVVNNRQVKDNPSLLPFLKSLAKRIDITVIEEHEFGPTFSAMQVKRLPPDEPVIISYCDFVVSWNYESFKNSVISYDAAIPYFKGFHPASFGTTKFAYMKLDVNNELIELREKECFSDNRHQEPASAGIYYFKTFGYFEKYARLLMAKDDKGLPEAYVSLLSNIIVNDGGRILATEVKNFICFGTPADVEQYAYWYNYNLNKKTQPSELPPVLSSNSKSTNMVPMAGKGSRFAKAHYKTSKPLIGIFGLTMIERASCSMPRADDWVYLCRQSDLDLHPLRKKLKELNSNTTVIGLANDTDGQAVTCLFAKNSVSADSSLFIASCDYEAVYDQSSWRDMQNDVSAEIIVWTIKLGANLIKDPKSFAYCKLIEGTDIVEQVVEKNTISDDAGQDHLVIGSFWFKNASDFFNIAERAVSNKITVNGEVYIGNALNQAIKDSMIVRVFEVKHWISFGDPWELDLYYYWMNYFGQNDQIFD